MARRGARTSEGKALVALNAVKHGVLAATPVLPGLEEPALWERHRAGVMESLAPAGHLERVLAERLALLLWRLGRVTRYEGEVIALRQEEALDNTKEEVYTHTERLKLNLKELQEREDHYRSLARLVKRIPSLPDDHPMASLPGAEVVYAVEEAAFGFEGTPKDLAYPGVPEGLSIEEVEGWTAGKVRECLAVIAQRAGRPVEELLAEAVDDLLYEAKRMCQTAEGVRLRVERAQRWRMLPPADEMEKISRYEVHLNRQFTSTLRELEALQARRQGQAVPKGRPQTAGVVDEE